MESKNGIRNAGLKANGSNLRSSRRKVPVWQYLLAREEQLRSIHPQWDFNETQVNESKSWFKRKGPPICIPPSWDMVKKYAGAVDSDADGFDEDFYKYGLRLYNGDHGEAAFLAMMQQSAIGGLLIGNIDSRHMLLGRRGNLKCTQDCALPKELMKIVEEVLLTSKTTEHKLSTPQPSSENESETDDNEKLEAACSNVTQDETNRDHCVNYDDDDDDDVAAISKPYFEIDFVMLHPTLGICQIEVKSTKCKKRAKQLLRKGLRQLSKGILKRLFINFYELLFEGEDSEILWQKFNAKGAVVFAPSTNHTIGPLFQGEDFDKLLARFPDFVCYHNEIRSLETKVKDEVRETNFFENDVFKYFAVFLSCFRPDFFISPALCAIRARDNILTQKVNATRFYELKSEGTTEMRFDQFTEKSLRAFQNFRETLRENILPGFVQKNIHEFRKILAHAKAEVGENPVELYRRIQQLADEERNADSIMSSIMRTEIASIIDSVLTKDRLLQLLQPLKKGIANGLLNSRQNNAKSVQKYLSKLKEKGFIRHSDIFFLDGRADIYFTREQLKAIDVFDRKGQPHNQRQLIMGPPGSGKSIILMVKLFILKQIRPEFKLAYASWFKHDYVVKDFLKRNKCKCCRKVEFFSEHGIAKRLLGRDRPMVRFDNANKTKYVEDKRFNETKKMREILDSVEYDIVLDERHVLNHLVRFEKDETKFDKNYSIGVLTGGYKLHYHAAANNENSNETDNSQEASFDTARMSQLIEPIRLTTVFRSTNHIRKYVDALMGRETISGHSFDGVPVEEWDFLTEADAFKAASEHIMKLNELMGKFNGTRQIALIAEDPQSFTAFLAYGSCLPHTELPQCANDVPSLEFPIVVVICSHDSAKRFLPISASRAICHLIVFKYDRARVSKPRNASQ